MTTNNETILAWHFATLNDNGEPILGYDDGRKIVVGETLMVDCDPVLCERGLHASIRPVDALEYANSGTICRVEVGGSVIHGHDKIVGTTRKCLSVLDITTVLYSWACDVAEDALRVAEVTDERSHNAITVKRKWVAGEASDDELDAARDAAWAAARAAAWDAAWAAARAAAWAAAWDAAWAAARAAAWAAPRAAAWAAAWDAAWAAARAAARAAAWAAPRSKYNGWLVDAIAKASAKEGGGE